MNEKEKRLICDPVDKQLLLDLVEKHLHVIENKKTDFATSRLKIKEWDLISKEFNKATTEQPRSGTALEVLWTRLKTGAKKLEASYSRYSQLSRFKWESPMNYHISRLLKKVAASPDEITNSDADSSPNRGSDSGFTGTGDTVYLPYSPGANITKYKLQNNTHMVRGKHAERIQSFMNAHIPTGGGGLEEMELDYSINMDDSGTSKDNGTKKKDKRARSANWDNDDKEILLDLISTRAYIIENKCINAETVSAKNKQWLAIANKFNKITKGPRRDLNQLKIQWKRMKMGAKKIQSNDQGDGPQVPKYTSLHKRVNDILKQQSVPNGSPDSSIVIELPGKEANTEEVPQSSLQFKNEISDDDDNNDTWEAAEEDHVSMQEYLPRYIQSSDPIRVKKFDTSKELVETFSPAHQKKIEELDLAHKNALHNYELQIKKELLKQERIKTRLLLLELRKRKRESI